MPANDGGSVRLHGDGQYLLVRPWQRVGTGRILDIPTSLRRAAGLLIGAISMNIGQIRVVLDDDAASSDKTEDVPPVAAVDRGQSNLDFAVKFHRSIIVDIDADAGALARDVGRVFSREGYGARR